MMLIETSSPFSDPHSLIQCHYHYTLMLQYPIIEGYWRILDESYKEQVFQCIINLVEEKDWDFRNFSLNECCNILEELYPR